MRPALAATTTTTTVKALQRLPRTSRRSASSHAPSSVAQLLDWKPTHAAENVAVNGFVRSVRSMKSHRFVSLGDGSSLAPLQALVPVDQAEGCASFSWLL
jgi:asparaginyl-tRNA synthetase